MYFFLSVTFSSHNIPVSALYVWSALLLLPIISGLFLPAWGPLSLGLLEIAFMDWFVQDGGQNQIVRYIPDPAAQGPFLAFACLLILLTTIFSVLYAITTKNATIQADRAVELEQAYAHLETAHRTIQQQALTDGLTGLANHRALMELLHKELARAQRSHRSFSVLFFDADRFKRVNDTYGHAAGDTVLCQIGERASAAIRTGDTIGRFGGEEFVILLPEADTEEARNVAERVRQMVAAEPVASSLVDGGIATTVSIGIATYPFDAQEEQTLLTQADEAMYIAKQMGRNQVRSAQEARRIGQDAEVLALLQEQTTHELTQREGRTPEQLRETYTLGMTYSLLSLLERRDPGQVAHAHAVSDLATAIARRMGIEPQRILRIGMAALLHDIGLVAIPDQLLLKPSSLSPAERTLLSEHTVLGANILEGSPFLADLAPMVRYHHEYWNGQGTPDHLQREEIPLASRIIAVAEAYDFMLREHPYRVSASAQDARAEMQRCAGTLFDPHVVQVLLEVLGEQERQGVEQESRISS